MAQQLKPFEQKPSGEWAVLDSNQRPPACKAGALPAELTARVPPAGFEPALGRLPEDTDDPISAAGQPSADKPLSDIAAEAFYALPVAIRLKLAQLSERAQADEAKAAARKSHKKKRT